MSVKTTEADAPEITVKTVIEPSEQIDVRAGECTYGQMVELGRVLDRAAERGDPEAEVVKSIIRVLHHEPKRGLHCYPALTIGNVRYAQAVTEAVLFWRDRENSMLSYTPTVEEKQAGYEALAKATGPTGVASTIAEKFGEPGGPNEVFKWEYSQVFMVLYIDLERSKFQKRLQDIRDAKHRSDHKNRKR